MCRYTLFITQDCFFLTKQHERSQLFINKLAYELHYKSQPVSAEKNRRRVATRYDRYAHTFIPAIHIAATVIFYLTEGVLSLVTSINGSSIPPPS